MKRLITAILALVFAAGGLFSCSSEPFRDSNDGSGSALPDAKEDLTENAGGKTSQIVGTGYIKTAERPATVFSADVDTASYGLFRNMVSKGTGFDRLKKRIGGSLVTSEMINYFSYDYSRPEKGELFGVNPHIVPCPERGGSSLLVLGFATEDAKTARANNFVFLVDVSGSMRSVNKLGLFKKSFSFLTENLGEKDIVSVVLHPSGKILFEGRGADEKSFISDAVNSLEAERNTAGAAAGGSGFAKACELAEKYRIDGENNRIVAVSDGGLFRDASADESNKDGVNKDGINKDGVNKDGVNRDGINKDGVNKDGINKDGINRLVSEEREKGIRLYLLGFGDGNCRDEVATSLALRGGGEYRHIDGESEARKVLGNELFVSVRPLASDVQFRLEFNPEYIESYRPLGGGDAEPSESEPFSREIAAGHGFTVCHELKLTERGRESAGKRGGEWLDLTLTYVKSGESEKRVERYAFGGEICREADDDVNFISAVAETCALLRGGGNTSLEDIIALLERTDMKGDPLKKEFLELLGSLER